MRKELNFSAKSVLVTGGGSGIGRALALELARLGASVFVCGRSKERLDEVASQAQGKVIPIVADIAVHDGPEKIREAVVRHVQQVDVLVNNAGIQREVDFANPGAVADSRAGIYAEIGTNLTAPIALVEALNGVLTRPGGTIVNITSLLAYHPKMSAPVYCASEAGLHSFTRALRYQMQAEGIRVVEVVPPVVDTEMTTGRTSKKMPPARVAKDIVAGLVRGQNTIAIGVAKMGLLINRIAPSALAGLMRRG